MWLHASLALILWILDGMTAQNLTTGTIEQDQSTTQNSSSSFRAKVFSRAASSNNLSAMDRKVIRVLKSVRDRKKESGEPLNSKEKKLIESLKTLQEKKGTKFRRTTDIQNFNDISDLIADIENDSRGNPGSNGGKSHGGKSCESCEGKLDSMFDDMMDRMDKIEEQQSKMLDKLEELLEESDETEESETYEYSRPCIRCHRPYPPYPRPPPWYYPPHYHIPQNNLYASPNCPCKNNGRCSVVNGGWAICVCIDGYKGQFCHKRKKGRRPWGRKNEEEHVGLMSEAETSTQKPFKWDPKRGMYKWLKRQF